jgi:hypothetical protein
MTTQSPAVRTLFKSDFVLRATALAAAFALAGCTTNTSILSGSKVDYRSEATKTPDLVVPPA